MRVSLASIAIGVALYAAPASAGAVFGQDVSRTVDMKQARFTTGTMMLGGCGLLGTAMRSRRRASAFA